MTVEPNAAREQARVVIVDDDEDFAALVEAMLQADGRFSVVVSTGDAAHALAVGVRQRAGVVLLGLDTAAGRAWCELPRFRLLLPDAAIAVVTAFPDPVTLAEVIRLGADLYLDRATVWRELLPELAVALDWPAAGEPRPGPDQDLRALPGATRGGSPGIFG